MKYFSEYQMLVEKRTMDALYVAQENTGQII